MQPCGGQNGWHEMARAVCWQLQAVHWRQHKYPRMVKGRKNQRRKNQLVGDALAGGDAAGTEPAGAGTAAGVGP